MALLHQIGRHLPLRDFHPAFGIDVHARDAEGIEHGLHLPGHFTGIGAGQGPIERGARSASSGEPTSLSACTTRFVAATSGCNSTPVTTGRGSAAWAAVAEQQQGGDAESWTQSRDAGHVADSLFSSEGERFSFRFFWRCALSYGRRVARCKEVGG